MSQFDRMYTAFLGDSALLKKHMGRSKSALLLAKAAAWRMARNYLDMAENFHNDLLRQARSSGKTIDQFCEELFEPLDAIQEDWRELVTAVKNGTTLAQYRLHSATFFAYQRSRSEASNPVAVARTEPEAAHAPPMDSSPEAMLEFWVARAHQAEADREVDRRALVEARSRIRELEHDLAVVNRRFDRLHRLIGKAKL